jgi:protein TonB
MFAAAKVQPDTVEFARSHSDEFVKGPAWFKRPSADDVSSTYPSQAKSTRVAGFAMLFCQVNEQGRLAPCEIIREQPEGLGFGDAAIKLTHLFAMRPNDWSTGLPVAGRFTYLPIRFYPPGR